MAIQYPLPCALMVSLKFAEPTYSLQAYKDPNWHIAMIIEFDALLLVKHGA